MAVYTEVSDEEVAHFVAEYDLGAVLSVKGIAEGVENSNFLLVTDRGPFILTLYEKRVREDDLPFFIGVMEHLSARGIACPLPVRGRDGVALRHLAGRPACVVTFLNGMWPKRVKPPHTAALGAGLAGLHRAGSDLPLSRPNSLSVADWRPLFDRCGARADTVQPGLGAVIAAELDHLEANWPQGLPTGLIHADLFPDNVFFTGERLTGFIDFYFACTDLLAYDVAICLNAWCFEADGSFNATKARHLLSQYHQVRPFEPGEIDALPTLLRGSALRFLLTRLYDLLHHPEGAFVKPKDPLEYLARLRFHQYAAGPADFGWAP